MVTYILAKICKETLYLGQILQFCNFADVANILLWKLLMNACMSDWWVRQGLSQSVLLRSLGSLLRCDDANNTLALLNQM